MVQILLGVNMILVQDLQIVILVNGFNVVNNSSLTKYFLDEPKNITKSSNH